MAVYCAGLAPSDYMLHPNETSADVFCTMLVFDDFTPRDERPSRAAESMEKQLAPYWNGSRTHLKAAGG